MLDSYVATISYYKDTADGPGGKHAPVDRLIGAMWGPPVMFVGL
jgi:hypothetical protein